MKVMMLLLVVILSPGRSGMGQEKEAPKKLPEFTLKSVDGSPFKLTYDQGRISVDQNGKASKPKVVFIHFFQADCNLCMAEMKALETLSKDVGREGAMIVGVAHRHDEEAVRAVREKLKLTYPLLLGRGSDLATQFSRGDASILVDSQGMVRTSQVSYKEGEEKVWKENLNRLAAEKELTAESAKREKALEVGGAFPAVKLPSLMGEKGMSLATEDGKLTFRDEDGKVGYPKAAVGFFSRY